MLLREFVELESDVSNSYDLIKSMINLSWDISNEEKFSILLRVLRYTSVAQFEFKRKNTRVFV